MLQVLNNVSAVHCKGPRAALLFPFCSQPHCYRSQGVLGAPLFRVGLSRGRQEDSSVLVSEYK